VAKFPSCPPPQQPPDMAAPCVAPAICELCPDGTTSCATASDQNGICVVTFPSCQPVDLGVPPDMACVPNKGPGCCYQKCLPGEQLICLGGNICGYPCSCSPAPDMATTCDPRFNCCPACPVGQTCCVGQPFATGTCITGTICPISRRRYKTDVEYLDAAQVERLGDELMQFRLAKWRYRPGVADGGHHLGFIIDDVEPSAAVAADGEMVDLYGYTSMAVAALQSQQRQIKQLEREVKALRARIRH
jgi:hypothetical protein